MGWFDDQIKTRKEIGNEMLQASFRNIAQSVTGEKPQDGWMEDGADVKDAASQLLKYFHVKEKEVPANVKDLTERIDFLLSSTGIIYRKVKLEKGWHNDSMGALIATLKEDGSVITVLPHGSGKYYYIDPKTAKRIKVTGEIEKSIDCDALCFYRPLPMRKLSLRDLFRYMKDCLDAWDYISFGLAALAITLIGMLMPKLNYILMGPVVTYKSNALLNAVMLFMLFATLGNMVFIGIKSLLLTRISSKISVNVDAAAMMRILSLPADFFRDYSSGELSQYLGYLSSLCNTLVNSILSTGITGIFSLIYLTQIFQYAKSLVVPSLMVTIITLLISMISTWIQTRTGKEKMKLAARENGLLFSLISGIQKIRFSGAENRAFSKWADVYSKVSTLTYNPPAFVKLNTVITTAISMIGTIIMYYVAVINQVTVSEYYAFNVAYAYISTAFTSLASVALVAATIKPALELVEPLMQAEPETDEGLETVTDIYGNIELSHVSFRYDPDGPYILDDISINIPSRQYVAIVGKTGSGKSTIVRLLLGFEKPTKGSIFYDRKDSKRLDMKSVRKKIGTVIQNGKLFAGSIYDNIVVSAPMLNLDDAWEAAEISGIADDIRRMPMGMHTMISEGSGGISGGQKQRLMIARAIAPKPKVLILDEATSALDNITQKKVSDALEKLKCTRIVIAHRLSTIKHCDRILVLDNGKFVEDGTYEELIEMNGIFAELIERQRVDT